MRARRASGSSGRPAARRGSKISAIRGWPLGAAASAALRPLASATLRHAPASTSTSTHSCRPPDAASHRAVAPERSPRLEQLARRRRARRAAAWRGRGRGRRRVLAVGGRRRRRRRRGGRGGRAQDLAEHRRLAAERRERGGVAPLASARSEARARRDERLDDLHAARRRGRAERRDALAVRRGRASPPRSRPRRRRQRTGATSAAWCTATESAVSPSRWASRARRPLREAAGSAPRGRARAAASSGESPVPLGASTLAPRAISASRTSSCP